MQKAISGTSGHESSMLMLNSQDMTSYYCSMVILDLPSRWNSSKVISQETKNKKVDHKLMWLVVSQPI